MKQEQLIEDIIKELDQSFNKGVGHVHIEVNQEEVLLEEPTLRQQNIEKKVRSIHSSCCIQQNSACNSPTLMEGLDTKEEI